MRTYLDWHLINMNTLFDAEFRNQDIESCIKDTNDLGLTNNGAISLGKVGYQDAEIQMG